MLSLLPCRCWIIGACGISPLPSWWSLLLLTTTPSTTSFCGIMSGGGPFSPAWFTILLFSTSWISSSIPWTWTCCFLWCFLWWWWWWCFFLFFMIIFLFSNDGGGSCWPGSNWNKKKVSFLWYQNKSILTIRSKIF